jgi:high-affinity iron transporter
LRRALAVLGALLLALGTSVAADAQTTDVQTAWRLLDYMAVDYGGAVSGGRVKSAFRICRDDRIRGLGIGSPIDAAARAGARAADRGRSSTSEASSPRKGTPEEVARIAHGLAADLLKAYPVPLAPGKAPDLDPRRHLVRAELRELPRHDRGWAWPRRGEAHDAADRLQRGDARARQRSPFALYQVIDQGIDGTAMQSFATLPSEDRWALAFYAGRFAFPDALASQGERLWKSDPGLRHRIPDLTTLAGLTPGGACQDDRTQPGPTR